MVELRFKGYIYDLRVDLGHKRIYLELKGRFRACGCRFKACGGRFRELEDRFKAQEGKFEV